jgi:hypothetical protein
MATYIEIASVTVGSGGTSAITFSSIPADYTDLKLVYSIRSNEPYNESRIVLNGSTAYTYSYRNIEGTGSSVGSGNGSSTTALGGTSVVNRSSDTASVFGSGELYFPNYAGSAYKSISGDSVQENNATNAEQMLGAGLWAHTAAITSISISPATAGSPNCVQYSTAYLYGIKKD